MAAPLLVPMKVHIEMTYVVSLTQTCNVDIVHVRGGHLGGNLRDQVEDELDVVRFTRFEVHIPFNCTSCELHSKQIIK